MKRIMLFSISMIVGTMLSGGAYAYIDLIDGNHLEYEINTDTSSTESEASAGVTEADYTTSVIVSTTGGGTTMHDPDDSFDGYGAIAIDIGGENGAVAYTDNGIPTLDTAGGNQTLVFGTQDYGNGIMITRKVFVPTDDTFCRWLTTIENTGESSVHIRTSHVNNNGDAMNDLGSDEETVIHMTASGDLTPSTDDNWIVSYDPDTESGNGPFENLVYTDPRIAQVFQNSGAPVNMSFMEWNIEPEDDDCNDGLCNDEPSWEFEFDIPAGETRTVMHFVSGQPSLPEAVAKAKQLEALLGSALDFMSPAELSQLVNFTLDPASALGAGAGNSHGSSCVVATAAYGTPMASDINVLRQVRDTYLLNTAAGTAFVEAYYTFSPPLADFVAKHPAAATSVRVLLTPVIAIANALWTLPLMAGVFIVATAGYALRRRKLSLVKAKG